MNNFPTIPLPNSNGNQPFPLPTLSLEQLEKNWQELLRFHQKIDPRHILPNWLLTRIGQQLKHLQNDPLLSESQVQRFHQTIEQLRSYLHQFQIFSVNRQLLHEFQKKQRKQNKATLPAPLNKQHYIAAQAYEKQLLKDFTRAAYWSGDISHTVSQFDYYVRQMQQQIEAPPPEAFKTSAELELFTSHQAGIDAIQTNKSDKKDPVTLYVKSQITAVPRLEPERMEQIKQGYFFLQNEVMRNYIKRLPHRLTKPLAILLKTLKSGHRIHINHALQNLKKYIKPMIIDEPKNFSTAPQRLIRMLGHAEPLSTVVIQVNNEEVTKLRADIVGDFRLDDITLKFGENIITCYSAEYFFLDNVPLILHLHFEESYPFIGRNDPLTQKLFQKEELNMIIKCQICGNFQYDFSIEETDGYCTIMDCDGSEFWNHHEPRFWSF